MTAQQKWLAEKSADLEDKIVEQARNNGATLLERRTLLERYSPDGLFRASALAFRGQVSSLYVFLESLYKLDLPFHIEEPHLSRDKENRHHTNLTFILATKTERELVA